MLGRNRLANCVNRKWNRRKTMFITVMIFRKHKVDTIASSRKALTHSKKQLYTNKLPQTKNHYNCLHIFQGLQK